MTDLSPVASFLDDTMSVPVQLHLDREEVARLIRSA
jgi:hypothetical protein